jgi:hypothetical protein
MKGRACFERARQCENLSQSQHILSGKPRPHAIMDAAVPGVPYVPPAGKGQGHQMAPQTAHGIVDPGNWLDATPRPGKSSVPITQEQRDANGPCWFYGTGTCVRKNCNNARRIMTDLERAAIPTTWTNWNLPENERKGTGGKDGYRTDRSQTETDDPGKGLKRWGKSNRPSSGTKGDGKAGAGTRPCRFIQEGKPCPHGANCYSFWSHLPTAPTGVDIAGLIKQSASSGASASDSGAIPWTGVKPTIKD